MLVSADNYVQAPDFTQSFNRYAYCLNNPMMYKDPSGEFWHIIAGALIGGAVNLALNWNNCSGFWEYTVAFSLGAAGGAATAAVGGTDGGASFWAITGTSAAACAVTTAGNSVIAQTGTNFSGIRDVDWGLVGRDAAIAGVAGFGGSATGYWAANTTIIINGYNSPILKAAIVTPIASGAGHIAGGTTAGLLNGQSFGVAFENSFRGIGQSMALSTGIGITTAVGMSYANKINPLTGESLNKNSSSNYNLPVGRRGNPMDARGTNEPTIINDRLYTGHALDQMQGRGFVPSAVENAINNPITITPGNTPGTYVYYSDGIKVVTNLNGDVITVIPQ